MLKIDENIQKFIKNLKMDREILKIARERLNEPKNNETHNYPQVNHFLEDITCNPHLLQIIELNKFILTSSSNIFPHCDDINTAFISFYAPPELASLITDHFSKFKNYSFISITANEESEKIVINMSRNFTTFISCDIRQFKDNDGHKDYPKIYDKEISQYIKDNYSYVELIDDQVGRIDLYELLINFLHEMY